MEAPKKIEEGKSTAPTRGGVGKRAEELPWELWELVLGNLSAVDRLSCVTSTKVMMEKYEKGRNWPHYGRRSEMRYVARQFRMGKPDL